MREELLKRDYIQADETVVKVLDDKGKESKKQKYMWFYKSPDPDGSIIIYDYQRTRSGSCPKDFLGEYPKYLQTDGYAGYNTVENAKRFYCLVYIRRKFHDIIVNLNEEALKESRALIGFNYCAKRYKIEKELREQSQHHEDYHEKRYTKRLEDGALEIDNNGADSSALLYIIIETAKGNSVRYVDSLALTLYIILYFL